MNISNFQSLDGISERNSQYYTQIIFSSVVKLDI